jgi:hypothetical protein
LMSSIRCTSRSGLRSKLHAVRDQGAPRRSCPRERATGIDQKATLRYYHCRRVT